MLRGTSEEIHTISIDVEDSETIEDKEITEVEVTIGVVTNVGEISVAIN